jgi:DNA replication initiation complex subunit (GINS family)
VGSQFYFKLLAKIKDEKMDIKENRRIMNEMKRKAFIHRKISSSNDSKDSEFRIVTSINYVSQGLLMIRMKKSFRL